MCIFSGDISEVSATHIFARGQSVSQYLVYQMVYAASAELAMVLPLPVAMPALEDAVTFLSLESYPDFFADLHTGFPTRSASVVMAAGAGGELAVHDVGMYEASFVPSLADFRRLDGRFQLAPEIWEALPTYADYGFAVFKLKPTVQSTQVHPMAFRFARRNPDALYFPTLHVHDGESHVDTEFDHTLYCQAEELSEYLNDWRSSFRQADSFMDVPRTNGIVVPQSRVWRRQIIGRNTNVDSGVGRLAPFPKPV